MVIDGNAIAKNIKSQLKGRVKKLSSPLTLYVFVAGGNAATEQFIGVKKEFADDIGVSIVERRFSKEATTEEVIAAIKEVVSGEIEGGIIVQLPLPESMDTQKILDSVPLDYDVDVLSTEAAFAISEKENAILPPVVGAIREIINRNRISVKNKHVVIVGKGRLVGKPATIWFEKMEAKVVALGRKDGGMAEHIKQADIIVTGAGSPGLIKQDMVKDGVVIFDAGTSEAKGKLVGDVDFACATKAAFITPVPGGIGPITVAILFKNLLALVTPAKE